MDFLLPKVSDSKSCNDIQRDGHLQKVERIQSGVLDQYWPGDCISVHGNTLLHIVCRHGQVDLVRMLLTKYKADLKARNDRNNTPLHEAAERGQTAVVNCIIKEFNCGLINAKGEHGYTALHYACLNGHTEVVDMILVQQYYSFHPSLSTFSNAAATTGGAIELVDYLTTYGIPVNCRNDCKQTPLHLACGKGHLSIVKMLVIKHKADLKACDQKGCLPLHEAAFNGQTEVVNCLINEFNCESIAKTEEKDGKNILHCASSNGHIVLIETLLTRYKLNPLSTDNNGNTPLHYAAAHGGTKELVDILITKYGVPVDCINNQKQTPLHLACRKGHLSVVKMLVSKHKADLNAFDQNGYLPLHEAALSGQTEVINCLINEFNNYCESKTNGSNGQTILHCASSNGHSELIEILLTRYKLDPLSNDINGNIPLHYAAHGGAKELLDLFVAKYRVPVDCRNNRKQTPLHLACRKGKLDIVKLLVTKYKADLNVRDQSGFLPLHVAAFNGQTEVVNSLINEFNCEPKTKGNNGNSILHYACLNKQTKLVETLLTCYADLDPMLVNDRGNTPLHFAAYGGAKELVSFLITKYGVPVDCRNNQQETPLHMACRNGNIDIVKMLVTKYKANSNACDQNGIAVLYHAVHYGQAEVMNCLINEFGCDPKTKGGYGVTLLHYTCLNRQLGNVKLIETLLTQYRLDPLSTDSIYGNTPLHCAAIRGAKELVDLFITKHGVPVDCRNSCKLTPLHLACRNGHLSIVKLLLTKHKANITACDQNGSLPLHVAAMNGQTEVVNCLINEFNCKPKRKGNNGNNVLHYACLNKQTKLAETLLTRHDLDPLLVNDHGNTSLHCAAIGGDKELVDLFITKYCVSVDYRNNYKQTPLHLACMEGSLSIVKILLSKHKADINACNQNGLLPLHEAAWNGRTEVINCLINEFNCDPKTKGKYGRTILHCASSNGHIELIETLLTQYKLDLLSTDNGGNTSLHCAALGGAKELVDLHISKYSVSVDCKNDCKQTPLHLACKNGHLSIVKMLVSKYKADLNAFDQNGCLPLHEAAMNGQTEIINCLINDFNCEPNAKGNNGQTILHFACLNKQTKLVETLLTLYDLNPLLVNDNGNTPLHFAAFIGANELIDLFITKYGVPVDCRNKHQQTPLHLACSNGKPNTVKVLVTKYKANINVFDHNGKSPIHEVSKIGQINVLKFLISECNVSPVTTDSIGNTPLHISAMHGQVKCMFVLLFNYHVPIFLRNKHGKTAMDVAEYQAVAEIEGIVTFYLNRHRGKQFDYKELQSLSTKKYSGSHTLTRIFVLGNKESGKSTLIESLKRSEGFFSSWRTVTEATVPPHTSGIIPSAHHSESIGRILYYDFAGDQEYHSSHSAVLSSLMLSKIGTNVFLIVVNYCKDIKVILEELGYWFHFVSYHVRTKCKVLVIGSHVDTILVSEASEKFQRVADFAEQYLSETPDDKFQIMKKQLTFDCRWPRSAQQLRSILLQTVKKSAIYYHLSIEANILLGLLAKDFENVVTCKPQTLIKHIKETGVYLPHEVKTLYPAIAELHALGFLMIINEKEGKNFEDMLLLLDVQKLTHEVHQLLFSDASIQQFLSSTNPFGASVGILPRTYLESILPEYITIDCLIQLQYCNEFSHAEVKYDYSVVPTADSSASTFLYFPALCRNERKKAIISPDSFNYNMNWYFKCTGKFDYLPPRFLHVLFLRLAYSFALPTASSHTDDNDAEAVLHQYNRRCTMWKNGIHWLMEEGVECYVENVENSKGIIVITRSEETHKCVSTEMLVKIMREITQAKEEFCGTIALQQYLIDSNDPMRYVDENKLYLASDICRVLKEGKRFAISVNGNETLKIEKVSHLLKYIVCDTKKGQFTLDLVTQTRESIANALSVKHHLLLFRCLCEYSAEWEKIGLFLGFRPGEIKNIRGNPLLMNSAPIGWLSEMLDKWLQWAPGDERESKNFATLESLKHALNQVGLSETFHRISNLLVNEHANSEYEL